MAIDPLVRVIFHVMLTMPQALPGAHGPWYCAPGSAHVDVPTPRATIDAYERELRRFGTVTDHFGFGTWTVGRGPASDVAFEEGDHLEWVTRDSTATRMVPAVLRQMRIELRQRETLAEVLDRDDATLGPSRTHIVVTVPFSAASYARVATIHTIFGNHGDGGATQTFDERGVEIASGVRPADAARIVAELRRAGFAPVSGRETFVTSDAPPCP